MAHSHTVAAGEKDPQVKLIWRTFWILLVVTAIEVGGAFFHLAYHWPSKWAINLFFIILTIVKAFYIVAEFMHLKHEVKNLIWTILAPLLLFVWFIIAFLFEGNSWKNMRRDLSTGNPVKVETVAPQHGQH